MPITDGARIYALASGVIATHTLDRLREAGRIQGIADDDIRSFGDAFEYLQMLRLRTQHRRAAGAAALRRTIRTSCRWPRFPVLTAAS